MFVVLKIFQIDGITNEKLTGIDLKRRAIQLAKALSQQFDIKAGDMIALSSENRLEYPIITFATICLGATIAPLNVTYTDREYTD